MRRALLALLALLLAAPAPPRAQPAAAPLPLVVPAPPERGDPGSPTPGARPLHAVNGTAAAETLDGTPGPDALRGGGGADTLRGGPGDDTYYVGDAERVEERPGEGTDTVIYTGQGTLLLPPEVENARILRDENRPLSGRHMRWLGSAGGPSLLGNRRPNRLEGSAADNTLDGRGGDDWLRGGAGADTFVWGPGYGRDVVADFEPGTDRLRLLAGFRDWDAVRAALRDTPEGALLRLGPDDTLLLEGRRAAEIAPRDVELPPAAEGFRLAFREEFDSLNRLDGRPPDGGVWRTRMAQGDGSSMGPNDGQAFAYPALRGLGLDPFSVGGGAVRIAGAWRPDLRERLDQREFTGGVLTTEGRFSQQYGFWEARMRLPAWPGGFPAFWLLPSDHAWPPEIDVMEQLGQRPGEVYQMGQTVPGLDTTGWNVFGLEWTPDRLAWFVNGVMTHAAYRHNQDRAMYAIVNYALGGTWAGPPARPARPGDGAGAVEVDWVRVWEHAPRPLARPATRREGAPLLRLSVGDLLPGGTPRAGDSWVWRAEATGRLRLRAEDLGLRSLRGFLELLWTVDRAADSVELRVSNGWAGLNLQVEDADGARLALADLAMLEARLGGTAPSALRVARSGGGLVETGAGDDTVVFEGQKAWRRGARGFFEVRTGAGNDRIRGWTEGGEPGASLRADAGPGNDSVSGTPGDDVLAGGPGDDVLRGGPGRDRFVFRRGERGDDAVEDFAPGEDHLLLVGTPPGRVAVRAVVGGVAVSTPDGTVLLRGLPAGTPLEVVENAEGALVR